VRAGWGRRGRVTGGGGSRRRKQICRISGGGVDPSRHRRRRRLRGRRDRRIRNRRPRSTRIWSASGGNASWADQIRRVAYTPRRPGHRISGGAGRARGDAGRASGGGGGPFVVRREHARDVGMQRRTYAWGHEPPPRQLLQIGGEAAAAVSRRHVRRKRSAAQRAAPRTAQQRRRPRVGGGQQAQHRHRAPAADGREKLWRCVGHQCDRGGRAEAVGVHKRVDADPRDVGQQRPKTVLADVPGHPRDIISLEGELRGRPRPRAGKLRGGRGGAHVGVDGAIGKPLRRPDTQRPAHTPLRHANTGGGSSTTAPPAPTAAQNRTEPPPPRASVAVVAASGRGHAAVLVEARGG